MDLSSWIFKYYIDPIVNDTGYNPVNTITWALLLGISILGLMGIFRRLDLKMDERLVLHTIPFILAGASLRVIEDALIIRPPASYLLITPLIYFVVFFAAAASLILTRKALGLDFYRGYAAVGLLWTFINLIALSTLAVRKPMVPAAIFLLGSGVAGFIYLLQRPLPWLKFLENRYNLAILFSHMLDASSTYVGVDWFGYHEMHVVPTFLIGLTGTAAVMYPLKLLVLLPVLSLIDRSMQESSTRNFAKLALIVLGLAPAIRNTLRLTLGV